MAETEGRERLDVLLVERGLAPTRNKAQALILAGLVLVNDRPVDKAGTAVLRSAAIRLRGAPSKYVSRGGDKIEPTFAHFQVNLSGIAALDLGASTGGFTDCMLQGGAARIYAVDVGTNQLDDRLRRDPRVVVHEKTHAKELHKLKFDPLPSLAVIDVSFIGLRQVLDYVIPVLARPFKILALVKPQFELGPEFVEKGGVVREEADQQMAVDLVCEHGQKLGLIFEGQFASPLRGDKKGNQEYFVCFRSAER